MVLPLKWAVLWRAIVTGAFPNGALATFFGKFLAFFSTSEAEEAVLDALPLVGAIIQAIGAIAVVAQIAQTSIEVGLSPWTYEYDLAGTYDLSVAVFHDPKNPNGFPASASTYKATAVLDNGTPYVQTLTMPGSNVKTLPPIVFSQVPLGGGDVTVIVGFYTADGTQVGHGSTSGSNTPAPIAGITIAEKPLPIGPGVTYSHLQKTTLDSLGNHVWECAPAPAVPSAPSACGPNPGDLCALRGITHNPTLGYIGYAWQSYSTSACNGGAGQLDQIANIAGSNGSNHNAQANYATIPCALTSATKLVYDPLGRPNSNYYIDSTANKNILRRI